MLPLRSLAALAGHGPSPVAPASLATGPGVFPLWSRLLEGLPLSPAASGLAVSVGLAAAFVVLDAWDGNLRTLFEGSVPWWRHVEIRAAGIHALLLGVMLAVHRMEEAGARDDVARLRPLLHDAGRLRLAEAPAIDPLVLRVSGAAGALAVASVVPALYLDPSRFLRLETWALPSVLFDLAVGAVFGWTLGKLLYAGIQHDRAFAALCDGVARIDLLDLGPLYPFARRGLRRTGRWLLLGSLSIPLFLDAGLRAWVALNLAVVLGLAGVSFVLPIRGIHRRIAAEKARELAHLRAEILRERARVLGDGERRRGGGHLADLLAYEARLASAREWPVDTTILLRLAVLLLLPLGSWLGGALVERVVERFLG
jgi:hypothetical protein